MNTVYDVQRIMDEGSCVPCTGIMGNMKNRSIYCI